MSTQLYTISWLVPDEYEPELSHDWQIAGRCFEERVSEVVQELMDNLHGTMLIRVERA